MAILYASDGFKLRKSLFGYAKSRKARPDKYSYSGYALWFNKRETFLLSDGSGFRKNIIIVGADMNWSVFIDNRKKDISIHDKGPVSRLDDYMILYWL